MGIRRIRKLITMGIFSFLFSMGSYEILNFPSDARSLAMSNAASVNDFHILRNNPAALNNNQSSFSYSYFILPANIQYGMIQISYKINNYIIANKIALINYGELTDGETNETHSASDILFTTGFKFKYKHISSFGISLNYLISSIKNFNSNIICLNIGFKSKINNNRFGFGGSLENIKIKSKAYFNYMDIPPIIFRNSLYYKPLYLPATLNFEMKKIYNNQKAQYTLAIESIPINNIIIRLGTGWSTVNEFNKLFNNIINNYSFGIGLDFKKIGLDLGFKNLHSTSYIVGFSINKKIN